MKQRYDRENGGGFLSVAADLRQRPAGDGDRLLRGGSVLLFILAILAASVPRPAAANDAPVISGSPSTGYTATYSGNQQPDPIIQNSTQNNTTSNDGVFAIQVQNLTSTAVASPSADKGISLTVTGINGSNDGGEGLSTWGLYLDYTGGNSTLYGKNYGAYVKNTAGSGHKGGDDNAQDHQHGGDGGAGGTRGSVSVSNTSGAIQVSGSNLFNTVAGICAYSQGGDGGNGQDKSGAFENQYGGDAGAGGAGGAVTVTTYGAIQSSGVGIWASSHGGRGGNGGKAGTAGKGTGGDGGQGGAGGTINVTSYGAITTTGDDAHGIMATSSGGSNEVINVDDDTTYYGAGGQGGGDKGLGGAGGAGGAGGSVTVTANNTITTSGSGSYGIYARSLGGDGGVGGDAKGTGGCQSGAGGAGGIGHSVAVTNNDWVITYGADANGINAQSAGGSGGAGGECDAGGGNGNLGGAGGNGGAVTVTAKGGIGTYGVNAIGINAASTGGGGGHGGACKSGAGGNGGNGGGGGAGNSVTVDSYFSILTGDSSASGSSAYGIYGYSLGGDGGNGALGGSTTGDGGHGGAGGQGGSVTIHNHQAGATIPIITTYGGNAHAIYAQSSGGDGGNGGTGKGVSGHSGDGGDGGAAGSVTVTNDGAITSHGASAHGIYAISQGGAGGNSGSCSSGGGDTGDGGFGGDSNGVTVTNNGTITTSNDNAYGICAQSLGGNAGDAQDVGNVNANGGNGSDGGRGGSVSGSIVKVTNYGAINTSGSGAIGIQAESAGGAGGNGGSARSFTSGNGGNGGNGGIGEAVQVDNYGTIGTTNWFAYGIYGQSRGGDGGNGGLGGSVSGDGGEGGKGGDAGSVTIYNHQNASITTSSDAHGIYAQSTGGDGGAGGQGKGVNGRAGDGGAGGAGGSVTVTNDGAISTTAAEIYAQSSGGDGGAGAAGAGGGGEGGYGGKGGDAGTVTVTTNGALSSLAGQHGIWAQSGGGAGGSGGEANAVQSTAGAGGAGGGGGSVQVTANSTISVAGPDNSAYGIYAQSKGGDGGAAGQGNAYLAGGNGGAGGAGGGGGDVKVTSTNIGAISTSGANNYGICAQSSGGSGADGGAGYGVEGNGGNAGRGGASGQVTVEAASNITTNGQTYAINAVSQAGNGGNGGEAGGVNANGGNAGDGGNSYTTANNVNSTVSVTVDPGVTLTGGIQAASIAGAGGKGHTSKGLAAEGGDGGKGGASGAVQVNCNGNITVNGVQGILAQSIGGSGGAGGDAAAAGDGAGKGGAGGAGGSVDVTCSGNIGVTGDNVNGILAQSQGGSGGDGGSGYGVVGIPGDPGASAKGGDVTVTMTGSSSINTSGAYSCGILAQSLGGTGGGGGDGYGIISWGAAASAGADGGSVFVNAAGSATDNTDYIKTQGKGSTAIMAQSVGGGGGNGGSSGSLIVNLGGSGAAGGGGGGVGVVNYLQLATAGDYAYGIQSQSLGGGGGNGGGSVSLAADAGLSMGGSGGPGGDGGTAGVDNYAGISTSGASAYGILAQSVGGGGGAGGYSVTAGIGNAAISIGGSGGSGGDGNTVSVTSSGNEIYTSGHHATGILAQSIGGGGGAAHYAVTAGATLLQISYGGSGGDGGKGGEVDVGSSTNYCSSNITTAGVNAQGILAQSVGGGGGNAGWNLTAGTGITAGFGASGGSGGDGGVVNVYNSGAITTKKHSSQGILAQSVGGGGGNGGWSFAANVTPIASISFALGGSGGSGSDGDAVTVTNTGSISTGSIITNGDGTQKVLGNQAHGIFAQSVGGGGGNGGWAATGTLSFDIPDEVPVSGSLAVSLGGSGSSGGNGGDVTVNNLAPATGSSTITTYGDSAYGIFAQSVGGGGGNGGGSVAAALNFESESASLTCPVAIGGQGGTGGTGGQVTVTNQNDITTLGESSLGILAQSVGGGGGKGGWSITGSLVASSESYNLNPTISIGGSGGTGGDAVGTVTVTNTGAITTYGKSAIGIEAQSVGGGGGDGGWSFRADFTIGESSSINPKMTVGGSGGIAGNGGTVGVTNGQSGNTASGAITTSGNFAQGILAQSIGGGGGNGGATSFFSLEVGVGSAATESESEGTCTISPSVSVGGSGGSAGTGGQVTVTNYANISTTGIKSHGIQAQSIGGGGGNGGTVTSMELGAEFSQEEAEKTDSQSTALSANVTVGGGGGTGNNGGAVTVNNAGAITTQGVMAYGIFAQSVGGGGGDGGNVEDFALIEALAKALNHNPSDSSLSHGETISVGGNGEGAGHGGTVAVNNGGNITTSGICAHGIFAQSVGGGGGNGGSPAGGLTVPSGSWSDWESWLVPSEGFAFQVGGSGGSCGDGQQVTVLNSGAITTYGIGAHGIYAQSVGGGGGVATYGQSQMFSDGGDVEFSLLPGAFSIGGAGGAGGDGGSVGVTNSGAITTSGNQACGIYAQSIGGGGGNASTIGGAWDEKKWWQYFGLAVNVGRTGGSGGDGGNVGVTNTADITTTGNNANGIFAQSVGGAGGSGTVVTQALQNFLWNGTFLSGAGGNGGAVTVSQTGNITTWGDDSHGIVAQSMAGKDNGGKVNVTLNDPNYPTATPGNIITSGMGSCGIVAQSLGVGGNGDITITINQPTPNSGIVQGGKSGTVTNSDGSITPVNAYGVLILDGKNNSLNNYGSISTLDGVNGTAVMVQTSYGSPARGNLQINNYGIITGSIDQGNQTSSSMNNDGTLTLPTGQSSITFYNNVGATYNAGPVINLGGAYSTLSNGGLLSLGTVHSALNGNYSQAPTGTFQTTVNGDGSCGQLKVSASAYLDGTLQVLKGTGLFKNGTSSAFLTAAGVAGNFSNTILPASTSLVGFSLQYTGASGQSGDQGAAAGNAVRIISHVKSHTTVATSSTHSTIAGYLDQLLAGNPTGNLSRILGEFQGFVAPSQFRTAFESLHPGIYGANTDTTFAITRQYTRTLQQRLAALRSIRWEEAAPQALSDRRLPLLAFNGSNASLGQILGQGQDSSRGITDRIGCWMEGFGQWGSQGSLDGVSGYNYGGAGTGFGLDYAFTRNLIIGANFGYSYTSLNMDNSIGNGRINSLYGSLYGTYFTERFYVEGVLGYGNHHYDNSRRLSIGALQSSNQSSHTGNAFSILTEAGYKLPVQRWNFQPFVSLNYCNLTEGRFEESGELAAKVDGRSTNSLVSELGTQVDRPIRTSKGTLVPMVKVGWQHDFGVSKNSIPFTFIGAPVGVTVTQPRVSQDRAAVKAGLTFKAKGGVTSSIQYMGEIGEKTQNHGVIGQVRIAF